MLAAPNLYLTRSAPAGGGGGPGAFNPTTAHIAVTGHTPVVSIGGGLGYDSVGAGATGSTTTPSWTHVIGSSANAVIATFSFFGTTTNPTMTATCGGTSMTLVRSDVNYCEPSSSYASHQFVFKLASPPTGTQTIAGTVTSGGTVYMAANSVAYTGVTTIGAGVGGNAGLAVSASSGQVVSQAFGAGQYSPATNNFSQYSATSRSNLGYSGFAQALIIGDAPGATNVAFTAMAPRFEAAYQDGLAGIGVPMSGTSITFDAVGAAAQGLTTTPSWSHAISSSATAVVAYLVVMWESATPPTVTATCGGTSMTSLGSITNFNQISVFYFSIYAFGLHSPPTGTQTVAFNLGSGTAYVSANSVSYLGVTSFGSAATATYSPTALSMPVLSASGKIVVAALGSGTPSSGGFTSFSGNSRSSYTYGGANHPPFLIGDQAGAALDTLTATVASGATGWDLIAVPLT